MEWLNETITKLPKSNWLYRVICFFMFRKLTYKEYYLLLVNLNTRALGEENAKKASLIKTLEVYKSLHNGELPKGVEDYDVK